MKHTIIENTASAVHASNGAIFPSTGYVRIKSILAPQGPLPISRSSFWAGVRDGKFPRPRKISPRVTVWRAEDILQLLADIESGEA